MYKNTTNIIIVINKKKKKKIGKTKTKKKEMWPKYLFGERGYFKISAFEISRFAVCCKHSTM